MVKFTIREAEKSLRGLIQKAVAKLVPFGEIKGERQPGSLKGAVHVGPEFFEALPAEEACGWE